MAGDPKELALLETAGRVARLTLNRPEQRNALSLDLLEGLHLRLDELHDRKDLSVLLLTGAGKSFCAGMDLKAVLNEPGAPKRLLRSIAELTIKMRTLPMTIVGRINGAAIGGGCGVACVCDLTVTHPDAKIGFPEVDLSVCPAVVAPWVVQRVGSGRARRLLLSGGTMTGRQAHEMGLVSMVVERDDLDDETERLVERLAKAGPHALRTTKSWLTELEDGRLHDLVRRGADISAEVVEGEEARAALAKVFG